MSGDSRVHDLDQEVKVTCLPVLKHHNVNQQRQAKSPDLDPEETLLYSKVTFVCTIMVLPQPQRSPHQPINHTPTRWQWTTKTDATNMVVAAADDEDEKSREKEEGMTKRM
jgi:hypothetical protein